MRATNYAEARAAGLDHSECVALGVPLPGADHPPPPARRIVRDPQVPADVAALCNVKAEPLTPRERQQAAIERAAEHAAKVTEAERLSAERRRRTNPHLNHGGTDA